MAILFSFRLKTNIINIHLLSIKKYLFNDTFRVLQIELLFFYSCQITVFVSDLTVSQYGSKQIISSMRVYVLIRDVPERKK
jgi:hypothetical protein